MRVQHAHTLRRAWHHVGMNQGFGSESPRQHAQAPHRKATRYLVVIDAGGSAVARLFLDTREQVAEFDAGTEEATQMTLGLVPMIGAHGAEWDRALEGHSALERSAAAVYTLDI
jgi:hypothetical protein